MNTNSPAEAERGLFDYAEILWRRKGTVFVVFAAVFGAMAAYAFFSTPVYRASTLLDIEKPADVLSESGYQPTDDDFLPTQAKLIATDVALARVYAQLGLAQTREFAGGVQSLKAAVEVLPVPRTRLCYINVESPYPRLAAEISDALARDYLRQNLKNELSMPRSVLASLPPPSRAPAARSFYESLPVVAGNSTVAEIKQEIFHSEQDLAKLRSIYTDNHPAVIAAKSQLDLLRADLDDEIDSLVLGFRDRLAGQFRPNNVSIVDPATPPRKPIRPQKPLALTLGLACGLLLGCLAAFARETIDQTVRSHHDVERALGLPLLGHIPWARIKKGQKVYAPLLAADSSWPAEAFRNLRTMVAFSKGEDADPFVLVTSAVQQEGKSFVAANLAVAMAQAGRRVLLIDGDLRRPNQHDLLGAAGALGLSEFLSGRAAGLEKLAQHSEVPNLDVVAGGERPANPSELLSSDALAELIAWVRERYDRVVIDCPPVFPVSDVLLWGRHVRASILVARAGRTRLPMVRMACARLHAGNMDILGGVINGARRQAMRSAGGQDFDRYCRRLTQERS